MSFSPGIRRACVHVALLLAVVPLLPGCNRPADEVEPTPPPLEVDAPAQVLPPLIEPAPLPPADPSVPPAPDPRQRPTPPTVDNPEVPATDPAPAEATPDPMG